MTWKMLLFFNGPYFTHGCYTLPVVLSRSFNISTKILNWYQKWRLGFTQLLQVWLIQDIEIVAVIMNSPLSVDITPFSGETFHFYQTFYNLPSSKIWKTDTTFFQ